jgi:hypothetical protein
MKVTATQLNRARYAAFAIACALFMGLGLLIFLRVAHDPQTPDATHRYQLIFDPGAYVTHTEAIIGYTLFAAIFPVGLAVTALTAAYMYVSRKGPFSLMRRR